MASPWASPRKAWREYVVGSPIVKKGLEMLGVTAEAHDKVPCAAEDEHASGVVQAQEGHDQFGTGIFSKGQLESVTKLDSAELNEEGTPLVDAKSEHSLAVASAKREKELSIAAMASPQRPIEESPSSELGDAGLAVCEIGAISAELRSTPSWWNGEALRPNESCMGDEISGATECDGDGTPGERVQEAISPQSQPESPAILNEATTGTSPPHSVSSDAIMLSAQTGSGAKGSDEGLEMHDECCSEREQACGTKLSQLVDVWKKAMSAESGSTVWDGEALRPNETDEKLTHRKMDEELTDAVSPHLRKPSSSSSLSDRDQDDTRLDQPATGSSPASSVSSDADMLTAQAGSEANEIDEEKMHSRASPVLEQVLNSTGPRSVESTSSHTKTDLSVLDEIRVESAQAPSTGVLHNGASCTSPQSHSTVSYFDEPDSKWRASSDPDIMQLVPTEESAKQAFTLPRAICDKLYPYQREGVAWMAGLFQKNEGGILADDMGLGKTVQVCGFLDGARKAGATHALLLLPVTLLDQWAKEARKWCPGWPVYTYHGSAAQRLHALRCVSRPCGGVLLTSYQVLTNTDCLSEVNVQDFQPSAKKRGRPTGKMTRAQKKKPKNDKKILPTDKAKLQQVLLMDDECEEMEDAEDAEIVPVDPEIPVTGVPSVGVTRPWDVVICDEAHRLKGVSTLLGKSLRQLSSKCRILLSGTPIQNALQDLWSLMDFAYPGLLGNHATFTKHFSDPISSGSVRGANMYQVELKRHLAGQLRDLTKPYVLRRTKESAGLLAAKQTGAVCEGAESSAAVPDSSARVDAEDEDGIAIRPALQSKRETIVWLVPSDSQVAIYRKVLEQSSVIREATSKMKMGLEVFRAISLLKRLCNHPTLLLRMQNAEDWSQFLNGAASAVNESLEAEEAMADDSEPEEVARASLDEEEEEVPTEKTIEMDVQALPCSIEALVEQSAKLRCLQSLLPELAKRGHRTLVFSQSAKMLDLVQLCCLKPNGLRCLRIDGKTDREARAEKVDKFNAQHKRFQCMLLTTGVGGVGLNLTSADRVVIVDPAWNPAVDAQAVDRAFRIGQEREVRVYRLVMSGLIEDKMFRLQVFKMGLMQTALSGDSHQSYFTTHEIRALFDWTDPAEGETRKLLRQVEDNDNASQLVNNAANEDGASENWLGAGPAIGLSDFGLCSSFKAPEVEPNYEGECVTQLSEAKEKVVAADDHLQAQLQNRQNAESQRHAFAADLESNSAELERAKIARAAADDALKARRAESIGAKRAETASRQLFESVGKALSIAQNQEERSSQALVSVCAGLEDAANIVSEANNAALALEEAFGRAMNALAPELETFNASGCALASGIVDAPPDALKLCRENFRLVQFKQQSMLGAQSDLDAAANVIAIRSAELGTAKANSARSGGDSDAPGAVKAAEDAMEAADIDYIAAQRAAESTREDLDGVVASLIKAAMSVADGLCKTQWRAVRADEVKAVRTTLKGVIRRIGSSWQAVRKGRDAWTKASVQCRKTEHKNAAAVGSHAEAHRCLSKAQATFAKAEAELKTCQAENSKCETALVEADATRSAADLAEAKLKIKCTDLKAALSTAKQELKAAQLVEREALAEREALNALAATAEQNRLKLEEAKSSALSKLTSEDYNASQVEEAYIQKKRSAAVLVGPADETRPRDCSSEEAATEEGHIENHSETAEASVCKIGTNQDGDAISAELRSTPSWWNGEALRPNESCMGDEISGANICDGAGTHGQREEIEEAATEGEQIVSADAKASPHSNASADHSPDNMLQQCEHTDVQEVLTDTDAVDPSANPDACHVEFVKDKPMVAIPIGAIVEEPLTLSEEQAFQNISPALQQLLLGSPNPREECVAMSCDARIENNGVQHQTAALADCSPQAKRARLDEQVAMELTPLACADAPLPSIESFVDQLARSGEHNLDVVQGSSCAVSCGINIVTSRETEFDLWKRKGPEVILEEADPKRTRVAAEHGVEEEDEISEDGDIIEDSCIVEGSAVVQESVMSDADEGVEEIENVYEGDVADSVSISKEEPVVRDELPMNTESAPETETSAGVGELNECADLQPEAMQELASAAAVAAASSDAHTVKAPSEVTESGEDKPASNQSDAKLACSKVSRHDEALQFLLATYRSTKQS